jgi:hypothetical protein
MAGLVPAIHVFGPLRLFKTWMPATSAGMTVLLQWRLAMIAGGFVFGLFADRRPFGDTFLAHPIVVYAAIAGLGLLVLRVTLGRPVPEVIPERAIVVGFLLGIAAFLVGNFAGVHLLATR